MFVRKVRSLGFMHSLEAAAEHAHTGLYYNWKYTIDTYWSQIIYSTSLSAYLGTLYLFIPMALASTKIRVKPCNTPSRPRPPSSHLHVNPILSLLLCERVRVQFSTRLFHPFPISMSHFLLFPMCCVSTGTHEAAFLTIVSRVAKCQNGRGERDHNFEIWCPGNI